MRLKSAHLICLLIGIVLGALIWGLSPPITGEIEPWDSDSAYYWIALFFSGVIGYISYPRSLVFTITGIYLGQVIYSLIYALGPLSLFGIVVTGFYSLIALLGGWMTKLLMAGKNITKEGGSEE
ncbi:MAG: hypothetical protein R3F42_03510 [Pseudomonadota bacterium]